MVVPFLLIVKQPDLGTAVTLLPVFLGVAYLAGLRLRLLAIAAAIAVLLAPVAWKYGLKDYQKSRIATFLDPEQDPRGAGYQQIQARVTVGSGGLTGKGFMKGTQGQYKFLPVAHNDFIFSVLAEEHGFLGVLVALGLYLFVILQVARGGAAGQGPHRRVPGRRNHFGVHVPGDLQHHHVGRAGARQRADAAAHELWRVVDHRDARRIRPHPERQDAAVHELRSASRGSALFRIARHMDVLGMLLMLVVRSRAAASPRDGAPGGPRQSARQRRRARRGCARSRRSAESHP